MNIWTRAIFDALERRDANTVLFWSLTLLPPVGDKRLFGRRAGLCADDDTAALARLVERSSA
jgi:hypothetical protein